MPDQQMPASLSGQPPMGAGSLAVPTGNPGKMASALSQVRIAVEMLQKVLSDLPIGSPPHKAVMQAINSISKHVSPSDEIPGAQKTTLSNLQRDAQSSGMMQSLMRSLGGEGAQGGAAAPPGPGGGAPPMPAA